mmetsp:Transcript_16179/g.35296  ORF Transcript_16179/g.35296 Transcript_16179/m.35296 type:complete len:208 (-) Transcript_16179:177-800(-)
MVLFLAGAGAGVTSTIATYPFDIMRTQFALQGKEVVYKSMGGFISHTFRTKGVPGFYAGLTPAVVGITPYMGLNFALYETFKKVGEGQGQEGPKDTRSVVMSVLKKGLYGGAAGGISKFVVYPLDTVKKRMQAQVLRTTLSSTSALKYTGILNCFSSIYAHEGLKGFYRGIVPTTAKSVAATALTFAAYEGVKDFMAMRRKHAKDRE